MRSNIASTCGSESVPLRASPAEAWLMTRLLAQVPEEVHDFFELLGVALAEPRVRRHRGSRVDQRAGDRLARQLAADVAQVRARPGVAVLADPVAAEAAVRGHEVLAALVLG